MAELKKILLLEQPYLSAPDLTQGLKPLTRSMGLNLCTVAESLGLGVLVELKRPGWNEVPDRTALPAPAPLPRRRRCRGRSTSSRRR